jgi:hypothetical protein
MDITANIQFSPISNKSHKCNMEKKKTVSYIPLPWLELKMILHYSDIPYTISKPHEKLMRGSSSKPAIHIYVKMMKLSKY